MHWQNGIKSYGLYKSFVKSLFKPASAGYGTCYGTDMAEANDGFAELRNFRSTYFRSRERKFHW